MLCSFVHYLARVEEEIVRILWLYFAIARRRDLLISEAEVLPLRNVMLPEARVEVVTMVLTAVYRINLGRRTF